VILKETAGPDVVRLLHSLVLLQPILTQNGPDFLSISPEPSCRILEKQPEGPGVVALESRRPDAREVSDGHRDTAHLVALPATARVHVAEGNPGPRA
jgi:hypothetical protein